MSLLHLVIFELMEAVKADRKWEHAKLNVRLLDQLHSKMN